MTLALGLGLIQSISGGYAGMMRRSMWNSGRELFDSSQTREWLWSLVGVEHGEKYWRIERYSRGILVDRSIMA